MYSFDGMENIYFARTKEYFAEVLSSYFSENYRSAIVMLYSVVVCDLCLKLNELSTVYNDGTATTILNSIKQSMVSGHTKSEWESKLLDEMSKKGYLSDKLKSDIDHLYSDRCFSAHPSLGEGFELISPSKETTIAHIKNMLDGLFSEPPTFNKNLISRITSDLEDRKTTLSSYKLVNEFLQTAYYSRMKSSVKIELFKSLWNFCFNRPTDQKCRENAIINREALRSLCESQKDLASLIRKADFKFKFANEEWCIRSLCYFLSTNDFYDMIDSSDQLLIKKYINDHLDVEIISWFSFDTFSAFLDEIRKRYVVSPSTIDADSVLRLSEKCLLESKMTDFCDLMINWFDSVSDFYAVPSAYAKLVQPFLRFFNAEQLRSLLIKCNGNYAIYHCFAFESSIEEIVSVYEKISGQKIDESNYPNLFAKS